MGASEDEEVKVKLTLEEMAVIIELLEKALEDNE